MTIARVIDYETTGTQDDEHAEIIEFGRVDVSLEPPELIGNPWRSFARPRLPIPAVTMAVHHITDADVKNAPDARELWGDFIETDQPAYLVAHNARFEQHFTPDFGIPWICTYKVARIVWPDAPGHSNQVLRYWRNLPVNPAHCDPPHRALPDCYVTAALFVDLLAFKTPAEMVKISEYPDLLKTMNFGKHKGTTFEQAPIDYLEWIRDKSDMNEDTKFTARYWIAKRMK